MGEHGQPAGHGLGGRQAEAFPLREAGQHVQTPIQPAKRGGGKLPGGKDQSLPQAQALGNPTGLTIARDLLRTKLRAQRRVPTDLGLARCRIANRPR